MSATRDSSQRHVFAFPNVHHVHVDKDSGAVIVVKQKNHAIESLKQHVAQLCTINNQLKDALLELEALCRE